MTDILETLTLKDDQHIIIIVCDNSNILFEQQFYTLPSKLDIPNSANTLTITTYLKDTEVIVNIVNYRKTKCDKAKWYDVASNNIYCDLTSCDVCANNYLFGGKSS